MSENEKRKPGRPAELELPDLPIPATPEALARAIMAGPPKPKRGWRYLRYHKRRLRELRTRRP